MLSEINEEFSADKYNAWPEPYRSGKRKQPQLNNNNNNKNQLEQGKPVQCKREFCNLLSAAEKLLVINRSNKMLKIIWKMTWGRENQN